MRGDLLRAARGAQAFVHIALSRHLSLPPDARAGARAATTTPPKGRGQAKKGPTAGSMAVKSAGQ